MRRPLQRRLHRVESGAARSASVARSRSESESERESKSKSKSKSEPMSDFLVALGLVFVIEGVVFAAFPEAAKRAVTAVLQTPDTVLRLVGLASALLGLLLVWLMRG